MNTAFASSERSPDETIRTQHETLAALPLINDFLDAVPNMILVLNHHRQIVFGNRAFAGFLGLKNGAEHTGSQSGDGFGGRLAGVLGRRPGEAVGCLRAHLTAGGCGTSAFCHTCGALLSILNSQLLRAENVQECRMLRGEAGGADGALDLRVWSRPIEVGDEVFTVVSLVDISNEKRRAVLERIFFHDVLNTAGCVKGMSDLMIQTELSGAEIREVSGMISESAGQLVEEICAQQELSAAEHGDLKPEPKTVESLELLNQVVRQFHATSLTKDKKLVVAAGAEKFAFVSDPVLLRRVLINLVKNGLAAATSGGTVTLGSQLNGDRVGFTVHNLTVMPPAVQSQIFMRSFSTKGSGRGLGTYSIKLISEKYLRGLVSFISNAQEGTRFLVSLPRLAG